MAVDTRRQLAVAPVELVERHEARSDREREVLALRRPGPLRALDSLEVARSPVVRDRESRDLAVGSDHRGRAQPEVELARAVRIAHLLLRAEDLPGRPEREERAIAALEPREEPD